MDFRHFGVVVGDDLCRDGHWANPSDLPPPSRMGTLSTCPVSRIEFGPIFAIFSVDTI
jgi:hypothetical protein